MPPPISVFIIAKNEEDRIGRTLAAARDLADEIVVVDSGSTDRTVEIAEAAGARVLHHEWRGYGPQKRYAEDQCRNEWLFNLDADEVVSGALAEEIAALFVDGDPDRDAYRVPIAEAFPIEDEPHPLAYALTPVRLYRKSKGRYAESTVHDRVELTPGARVGALKGRLHHFSVRSLGDQIAKLNAYSDMQVEDMSPARRRRLGWRLPFEFFASFLKAYIGRRHFLNGLYGYAIAMNYAFHRHSRIAKAHERALLDAREQKEGPPDAST